MSPLLRIAAGDRGLPAPLRPLPAIALSVTLSLLACGEESPPAVPDFDVEGSEPRVEERLDDLRDVVRAYPDSGPAWGRLALTLQAHGFPDASLEAYAVARRYKPDVFAYSYLPAAMMAAEGRPEAEGLFDRAFELRPDYPPLLLRRAEWLITQDRASEAIELLEGSAAEAAAPAHTSFLIGRAALTAGDTALARRRLETAVGRIPKFADAHRQLAEVYRRSGDSARAELARERARIFELDPPLEDPLYAQVAEAGVSSRWHILRGQAHLAAGRTTEAISEFGDAVAILPEDAHARNLLGTALEASGRTGDALRAYREATELRPGFAAAETNLARTLFVSGRGDEAERRLEALLAEDPSVPEAYLLLGMFDQATGLPAAAAAHYVDGLRNADFDPRIAVRLAWILATARDADIRNGGQAVALAERVAALEAFEDPATLDVLGAAYAEYGDFERASAAAARAAARARQLGNADLADAIEARAALYRQGTPYRE